MKKIFGFFAVIFAALVFAMPAQAGRIKTHTPLLTAAEEEFLPNNERCWKARGATFFHNAHLRKDAEMCKKVAEKIEQDRKKGTIRVIDARKIFE